MHAEDQDVKNNAIFNVKFETKQQKGPSAVIT